MGTAALFDTCPGFAEYRKNSARPHDCGSELSPIRATARRHPPSPSSPARPTRALASFSFALEPRLSLFVKRGRAFLHVFGVIGNQSRHGRILQRVVELHGPLLVHHPLGEPDRDRWTLR